MNPTDMASLRKVMRASACLWGGLYNPIIPVGRVQPKAWRNGPFRAPSGRELARGYVRFFEPDVYVEAEPGLAEFIGLKGLERPLHSELLALDDLLVPEQNRSWAEPAFGLPILDVLRNRYETKQQFILRDPLQSTILARTAECAAAEAIAGCYPHLATIDYIEQGYRDVYKPTEVGWTPETWLKIFRDRAITPFEVTKYGLDLKRYWHHEPVIFLFDPTKSIDLIDLWNLRLEPSPVVPVPIDWIEPLSGFLRECVARHYRPLEGNPSGIHHHMTLEASRSISDEHAQEAARAITTGVPIGALQLKLWRTRIWHEHKDTMVAAPVRMKITADEGDADLRADDDTFRYTSWKQLSPAFASAHGLGRARWVNVLSVGSYIGEDQVGTVFPFNTFDRRWPRLRFAGGERTPITTEGWVFPSSFKGRSEVLNLLPPDEVVHGVLKERGVEAALSEPGRISKQLIQRLGSIWESYLLRDPETLKLLNNMAGSVRRRSSDVETVEDSFAGRTASLDDWKQLIASRNKRGLGNRTLDEFTSRDMIRLGLETACTHCAYKNWSGLDAVAYTITCERCLKVYPFPQGSIASKNRNFRYRVVGPCAVPDYALGSYASILTLTALRSVGGMSDGMTYAMATELAFDNHKCEADFIALRDNKVGEHIQSPDLIIGECKSFGEGDLIKDRDLSKLKILCTKLPGAIVVIAVLRPSFTAAECARISKFVAWARRPDSVGMATNPVILFTGTEVFGDAYPYANWSDLGPPHSEYTDYHNTKDLRSLAKATQAIYLGHSIFTEA